MRFTTVFLVWVTAALPGSQVRAEDAVDLVLVSTAPPLFTEARIKDHFAAGLSRVNKFGPLNDRLTVEAISYAEYQDLKQLAEHSVGVVEQLIQSPLVLKAAEEGWIVKAPDAGMNIAGIEVRYATAGEVEQQLQKFDVEAKEVQGARFRVRSKVLGDFTFQPDPAWDLLEYRLLQAEGAPTQWEEWPVDRARFLIRVERFPSDETSYGELKAALAENRATPIRFNGEREGLFSIANMERQDPGLDSTGWVEGAYELSLKATDTDEVWLLFPLTKKQKDLAIAQLRDAVKRQGETERTLAAKLNGAGRSVAGHVVAKKDARELSGRIGAQWQHLESRGNDMFSKTFLVVDSRRWGEVFKQEGDTYYIYVQVVNGQAATIKESGEFWGVASPPNWNKGQNPQGEP